MAGSRETRDTWRAVTVPRGIRVPFGSRSCCVARVLLAVCSLSPAWSFPGPETDGARAVEFSRALQPLVQRGLLESPTFRSLFLALVATPGVALRIQVQTQPQGTRPHSDLRVVPGIVRGDPLRHGCVVSVSGEVYLPPGRPDVQIALLGHELQHVIGILAPERAAGEEREAVRTQRRILAELRSSRPDWGSANPFHDLGTCAGAS